MKNLKAEFPKKIVVEASIIFLLLGRLLVFFARTSQTEGVNLLSYFGAILIFVGTITFLLQINLQTRLTEFLFITFQPLSTLILYLCFLLVFRYLGPEWNLVALTVFLYWSLWLLPALFPTFSENYSRQFIKPEAPIAKLLFRHLLVPLLVLAPFGVAVFTRIVTKYHWVLGLIYLALIGIFTVFTFQFYLVSSSWPNLFESAEKNKK